MIDGHCHLERNLGSLRMAFQSLHAEAKEAGVTEIILLNLPELAFNNRDVLEFSRDFDGFFHVFPGLDPQTKGACRRLNEYKNEGAQGLKLHPRLHGYCIECPQCVELIKLAGDLSLPVLIDCFPAGKNIVLGNSPRSVGRIAEQAQKTRIAIGHAGGHQLLDAMMIVKHYELVFADLSFTLLYYRNSHVQKDIPYFLESMKYKRVFWGTDYPDRTYKNTVELSIRELDQMGVTGEKRALLLSGNASLFLGK